MMVKTHNWLHGVTAEIRIICLLLHRLWVLEKYPATRKIRRLLQKSLLVISQPQQVAQFRRHLGKSF